MITIGIDPDSEAHGVAIYMGDKLTSIQTMTLIEIIHLIDETMSETVFSIENTLANNFIYARNANKNKKIEQTIARSVGRCQQAQLELQRVLDWKEIPYVLHKPQKGNWAKNKDQFEKITGWSGRSNADTRSAAWFGYLAVK